MNYEGIGVQPMIANVDIQFSYIGGSSLGGPINELQNALSFNYFANTNLYDSRAKLSKDEEEYLNQILENINKQEVAEAKRKQEEMEMIEEANFRPTELDVIVDTNTNNNIGVEQVPSMMNQDRV
jgi:CCR4-NOT transcriptional regulation complex NOT5 subunit